METKIKIASAILGAGYLGALILMLKVYRRQEREKRKLLEAKKEMENL